MGNRRATCQRGGIYPCRESLRLHGDSEAVSAVEPALVADQFGYRHQQRFGRGLEGQSSPGRLGIRNRAGRAGHGLLGDGTVKPHATTRQYAPNSPKPGLTRPLTSEERRRAQRVLLRVPVRIKVAGKTLEGATHTVSASGGLIVLSESLAQGTKIT